MLKKILVMGLLMEGPRHGYDINKLIKGNMQRVFELNPASTYYTLEKLEKEGHVAKTHTQEGKRPLKYVYELTDSGREEFFSLLQQSLATNDEPIYPIEIGLVFIRRLGDEKAAELVKKRIEFYKKRLTKLEAMHSASPKISGVDVPDHSWMIDHKTAHLRTEIAWLEKFLERIIK